jgi:hypothetical protein
MQPSSHPFTPAVPLHAQPVATIEPASTPESTEPEAPGIDPPADPDEGADDRLAAALAALDAAQVKP